MTSVKSYFIGITVAFATVMLSFFPASAMEARINDSALTAANHPRLVFTDSDFATISVAARSNEILGSVCAQIRKRADGYLNKKDFEHVLKGRRMLSVSREAMNALLNCAFTYKISGERKYLERAENDLITVCNFPDWNARKHFLDVGEMAAAVALAYDWLYFDLSTDTKALVREALRRNALTPASEGIWSLNFYKIHNNWNQVCIGGLVTASLATYEFNPELSAALIKKGVGANAPAVEFMYSPSGNYPEGYSYWNYGTIYQALLNTVLETALGTDFGLSGIQGFSESGKYMMFLDGPAGMCYNYYDSHAKTVSSVTQWYFASRFGDLSVLYLEKDRTDRYIRSTESRLLPLIAYYIHKTGLNSLKSIPAPKDHVYYADGECPLVLVHDTWTMDENDRFLGVKAGRASSHHAHMDAGSFVYDAFGERWGHDMNRPDYGELEAAGIDIWNGRDGGGRWTVAPHNNFHHSTLTVNNLLHKANGEAKILGTIDKAGRKGAIVDITAPLGDVASAVRTIYMDKAGLVVTDEVSAKAGLDAEIRWTFVTRAVPEITDGRIILVSESGRRMVMEFSSAAGQDIELWTVNASETFKYIAPGYYECGYTTLIKAGSSASVTVRLL